MSDEFAINAKMTLDTSDFVNSLKQVESMVGNFQDGLSEISSSLNQAENNMSGLQDGASQMASSLSEVESAVENLNNGAEKMSSSLNQAEGGMESVKDSASQMSSSLNNVFSKGINGLKGWGIDLEKFTSKGKKFLDNFGLDVDKLASKFGMSAPLMTGIVAVTATLTKLGQEMDEVTSTIAKGTGAIGDDLIALDRNAKKALVDGVGVSVQETGELIADLNTQFGLVGEELEKATVDFGHFAKVTGTDVKSAVNDVADVMDRWNIPAKKSKDLMNQLAKASQISGASVTKLMSSVKTGQMYLQQFGFNLSESIALLSSFEQNGIQTETVMTGMRTALAKFSSEGRNAREAFAEVSKQIKEAGSETEALQIAVETFGTRAGPEMFKSIRDGSADFEKITEEIRNAGTALDDTFEASRTSKDAMNDLKNALKGTFGELGQAVTAVFKNIIDSVTEIVRFIEPVITPIVRVIRTVVTKIAELISYLFKEIRGSIENNSIAWQAWVKVLNDVGKSLESIFGDIIGIFKDTFGFIFSLIGGRWEEAWTHAQLIFFRFARVIANICNTIANLFGDLVNFISKKIMGKFGDFFKDMYKKLIDFSHKTGNFIDTTGLGKMTEGMSDAQINKLLDKMFGELAEGKALEKVDLAESWGLNEKIADLESKLKELKGVTSEISDLGASLDFGGSSLALSGFDESGMDKMEQESNAWLQKRLEQQLDNITKEKEAKLEALREEGASQEQLDKINQLYAENQIALYEKIQAMKKASDMESIEGLKNFEDEKLSLEEFYADEAEKYRLDVMTNSIKAIEKEMDDSARKRYEMELSWLDKLDKQKDDSLAFQQKAMNQLAKTEVEKEEVAFEYIQKKFDLEKERIEMARKQALEEVGDAEELVRLVTEYYDTQRQLAEGNFKVEEMQHNERMNNLQAEKKEQKKFFDVIKKGLKEVTKIMASVTKTVGKVMSEVGKIVKKGFNLIKNGFLKLIEFDNDKMLDSLLEWEDKVLTFFTEGIHQIPAFIRSALQSIRVLTDNVFQLISGDDIKRELAEIVKAIADELPVIVDNIGNIVSTLIEIVVDSLDENLEAIINAIVMVVKKIVKLLPKIIPRLVDGLVMLFEGLLDAIIELLDDDEAMEKLVDAIVYAIQKIFETILKNLPKIIKAIFKIIVLLIKAVVKAIISIIKDTDWKGIWDAIKAWFGKIWDNVKNWFKSIGETVGGWFENIGNGIKNFFAKIGEWISGAWDGIKGFFQGIGDWFKSIWDTIVGWVEKIGDKMGEFFGLFKKDNKSTGSHVAKGVLGALTGGISWLFTGFADGTENAPSGLAVVGEEGPELVNFRGGEQVIPAPQTKQILQSGTSGSVFNVNFYETRDTTAYAMMRQLKGWQKDLSFNAVL